MTLTARSSGDWIHVAGREYIPHTFAMAIGTKDIRTEAGQTRLPAQQGQYTVRLRVDGRALGLAFFRILRSAGAAVVPAATPGVPEPTSLVPVKTGAAAATPVPAPYKLP